MKANQETAKKISITGKSTTLCIMKRFLLITLTLTAFVLLLPGSGVVSTWEADDIIGEWYTDGNEAIVRIYKNRHGRYFGRLEWIKDAYESDGSPKLDKENPDRELRNRPLQGLVILRNFSFENNRWTGGTIYDPENGRTYSCTIRLNNRNTMHVRGYVGISALGRTTTWTRKRN